MCTVQKSITHIKLRDRRAKPIFKLRHLFQFCWISPYKETFRKLGQIGKFNTQLNNKEMVDNSSDNNKIQLSKQNEKCLNYVSDS